MRYTVKQLATLAGVTIRTLHYYDEIGLLQPASHGENGYRYYDEQAVLRLQQILFYRELDLSLEEIRAILDRPDFDLIRALRGHRRALLNRRERIDSLIETIDKTVRHLKGEIEMSDKDFYSGFDEEKQKEHAKEAERRWGGEVAQSQQRWNAYSRDEKNDILAQMNEISINIAANMDKGPESAEVQQWIARWHQHINRNFYTCSLEVFEQIGHGYVEDPEFTATYENIRPGMAAFMDKAMTYYCKVQAAKTA
jgi:DNA-binding transcriptional MerR regulator